MPVAFIVDGLTEKLILQRLCPGSVIRMTGMNGKDVSLTAIAKRVISLVKLLKDRHYPIVMIADREGRNISSEAMEAEVARILVEAGAPKDNLIVSCPDRMLENWMLGDRKYFEEVYGVALDQAPDGFNGKVFVKGKLHERKVSYHEATVGVEIFCGIDPHAVAQLSPSFARLKERTAFVCQWLRLEQCVAAN